VLEILDQVQKPLSPYDIQRLLGEQGKYLNHVTIYRILNLFCHLNLTHRVLSSGGFVKCVLGKKGGLPLAYGLPPLWSHSGVCR
jgi:Fe2+ or Zn2+ uptake regulation protein